MKINIFSDSSHGWAEVSLSELDRLGIAQKISRYSYVKGETAFLEEDCDLAVYLDALRSAGEEFTFEEHHTNGDSRIRGYNAYRVTA